MILLHTFGTAQIDVDETHVLPNAVRKFALLLYLAAERGRRVPRTSLIELIFPGQDERRGLHSLRELLYQCRQAGANIAADPDGVRLAPEAVTSDYERLIAGEWIDVASLAAIQSGLLRGYAGPGSDVFTAWLEAYRERLTLDVVKGLIRMIERAKSVGDWMMAEQAARACLSLDALNEEATLALAEMIAISGSKAQAIKLLDRYEAEVGGGSTDLRLPARVVRRRIRERLEDDRRIIATLPFIGRDAEMLALSERFELARGGQAQSVVVAGEAGIGKSRLVEEFCTKAILEGAVVAKTVAQPVDARRPMSVFVDLVPQLRELPGALGCSPESLKTLNRLTVHDPEGHRDEREQSSEYVWAAIAQAIGELTDAITSEVPLIVFLDDAQWVDEVSLRALGALSTPRHPRRLLLLATSRDAQTSRLLSQRPSQSAVVSLTGLTVAPIKEAVMRTLGRDDDTVDGGLLTWLSETSRGNPFFLQCLIGHYQATGRASGVPQSINGLLDQQMDALSPDAASMLRMIVTLGRHSDAARLLTALEMPQYQFQNALHELERQRLVTMHGERVEAAHWLIADAAKRTNTPIAAKLMSRRVASLLENDAKETQSPSLLWDCAEKWVEAGDNSGAVAALKDCALFSEQIGRPREAAEALLRAAELSPANAASVCSVEALKIADQAGESDIVLRAVEIIRRHTPDMQLGPLKLAEIYARLGLWDTSVEIADTLRLWLDPKHDVRTRIKAGVAMLIHADQTGNRTLGDEVVSALASTTEPPELADRIPWLTIALIYEASFGNIARSRELALNLMSLSESLTPALAAPVQRTAGVALVRSADTPNALVALKQAHMNAKASGLTRLQCGTACMIAGRLADLREYDETDRWLDEAEETANKLGEFRSLLDVAAQRTENALTRGDVDAAKRWIEQLRQVVASHSLPLPTRWLRALESGLRLLIGEELNPDKEIPSLVGHHGVDAEVDGISDIEVGVAMRIYIDAQRPALARELFERYMTTCRRTKVVPAGYLRGAIELLTDLEF